MDLEEAHSHSIRNRDELIRSEICGCFFCSATFTPAEITGWIDEPNGEGKTAECPRCGIDSVIGSASGYPIGAAFLREMHDRWFGP
jgi:hypothetical protein